MPDSAMTTEPYGRRPSYAELLAVIAAGALHVVCELAISAFAARVVNGILVSAFAGYLIWRVSRDRATLHHWGFRRDNLGPALLAHLGFASAGSLALIAIGSIRGTLALPATFVVTLALYPLWGLAQQFALQNLIARNLAALQGSLRIALLASILFAASHLPRWELVALTFAAGVPFTLIYRRFPNLWAVGLAHGVLGSLAFYLVLEEDPGAMILGAIRASP
ncbi:MAG TPA: CPBP family intramembrane glutamic endopeptidase [Thermoanaerobaculia bacterium]|nr:CPBP family intramembrane glutamic endopeptidase [Thermoanaerobaculia bacterium]